MRRLIARAVAVVALLAGIAATTAVPADAAPTASKKPPVTTQDWWM